MTKEKPYSDTFGVVGQSPDLKSRVFCDRFPVEFTLDQKEFQGGFLRVDSLASAFLQGHFHAGACARVRT